MPIACLLPILGSALILGVYDITKKSAVRDNAVMPALFYATLCGSLFFLAVSLCRGTFFPLLTAGADGFFFLAIFLKSMIVSASWICVYYAMRDLPISIAVPIRASSPLWVFFGSLILYHEIPTLLQGAAMLLIFSGYYLFSVFGKLEGITFRHSKGLYLILLGTLIGAGSALYDKLLLGKMKYPHDAVQFWFSIDLVLILGVAYFIRSILFRKSAPRRIFQWRWSIPVTGILLIGADFLYFYALSIPDTPISILSLVRRSNCIISFAVGSIWFHEVNKRKKACALALILLGIVLLAL